MEKIIELTLACIVYGTSIFTPGRRVLNKWEMAIIYKMFHPFNPMTMRMVEITKNDVIRMITGLEDQMTDIVVKMGKTYKFEEHLHYQEAIKEICEVSIFWTKVFCMSNDLKGVAFLKSCDDLSREVMNKVKEDLVENDEPNTVALAMKNREV